MVDFKKLSMLSNISRDIVNKEHPSFDENRKRVFCLGFLGGFNYSEKNPDANSETIDAVSRDSMNRSNPWYEEYEKETYLLGYNRGYSYVANDEARHYKQYMENPFSDQIGLGEATPDYDSADAAGLGVQFPILLNGAIIGWLPVDAIYDKDKPNHLISDDSHYLRMSSVGDSAEIKKEYRGQGYGKAAYYELAVKAARMGMVLCSAPDSSRSENANNLWKSLVSSGYARQNGDRYEFINSKIIVTNKAVGGGIQTASKDMEDIKDNKPYIIETEDDSLLDATNVSLKKDQLKALAVKLFGENAVLRTWAYPELDREVCLGDMPYTIRIDSIEIKDGELKLMSQDLGGEIEQSALHWDDVEAISAMLKEASVTYEKRHEAVDLADKVWDRLNALMPVYGDKLKVSEPFTLTYPDRYCSSGEPCKVDSVIRSLRSSNLAKDTFYFGNKKGGVEIYDMSVTDLKTLIMPFLDEKEKELSDAKTQLTGVLEAARADLGDTISIKPTPVKLVVNDFIKATGIFFAPDGEGGGEYRLLGRDSAMRSSMSFAISAEINGHKEFEVGKILDTVASFNSLAKAVRDTHSNILFNEAKRAIEERIINPSARSFTDSQVKTLNRYHEVVTPDTPADEVFRELLNEVAKDPYVARKPEKWVTDTAKELDGLAEGITRDQGQGLRR